MHESPVSHFGWSGCLSFHPSVPPSVRQSVCLSYTGCDYRVVIRDQWLAPTPGNNEYPSKFGSPPIYAFSHVFYLPLIFSDPLSLSHSSRFSYNNILIPLIHATLAAKPNKLKAAVRARRLRGLLNVACCRCRCCWTLPAFRRTHFLGFSHLHLPGRFGWAREQALAWVLLVCVNH